MRYIYSTVLKWLHCRIRYDQGGANYEVLCELLLCTYAVGLIPSVCILCIAVCVCICVCAICYKCCLSVLQLKVALLPAIRGLAVHGQKLLQKASLKDYIE